MEPKETELKNQLTNLVNAAAIVLAAVKDVSLGGAFESHRGLLKMEIEEAAKLLKNGP